ncbi:hypothetical protein GEV43_22305 [Actinomadura sp. J1-007]|nr:hypothetical protein [Actinomadura sp. J1-007]
MLLVVSFDGWCGARSVRPDGPERLSRPRAGRAASGSGRPGRGRGHDVSLAGSGRRAPRRGGRGSGRRHGGPATAAVRRTRVGGRAVPTGGGDSWARPGLVGLTAARCRTWLRCTR